MCFIKHLYLHHVPLDLTVTETSYSSCGQPVPHAVEHRGLKVQQTHHIVNKQAKTLQVKPTLLHLQYVNHRRSINQSIVDVLRNYRF